MQLQINYLDWEDAGIQSARMLRGRRKHGKPVFVMEPVKGGALCRTLPPEAVEPCCARPTRTASPASWALALLRPSLDGRR